MFIKAFITMVAADAVDRHLREQQHQAWIAQEQARLEAAAATQPPFAAPVTPRR